MAYPIKKNTSNLELNDSWVDTTNERATQHNGVGSSSNLTQKKNYKFIEDPNNSIYKTYADSLSLYNKTNRLKEIHKEDHKDSYSKYFGNDTTKDWFKKHVSRKKEVDGILKSAVELSNKTNIMPQGFYADYLGVESGTDIPLYKKPTNTMFLKGTPEYDNAKKQETLKNAGYDIAVDGVWGKKSEEAMNKYKSENPKTLIKKTNKDAIVGVPAWATIDGYTLRTGQAPGTPRYILNESLKDKFIKGRPITVEDTSKFGFFPGSKEYNYIKMLNSQYNKK